MKNRKKLEGANSDSSKGSPIVILSVVASLAAAAWYFISKGKTANVNIDLTKLIDSKGRTKAELIELAKDIKEMYSLHGRPIDGLQLETSVQEFLNTEKGINSNTALKQIETRLASEGQNKELSYGKKYGLYGFDDFSEQSLYSLIQ